MQVTDLLAPLAARWGRRVRDELDVVPHPFDSPRQIVAGPDPDRVLVLGNGPAIGFGVLTQELALPGRLARRLHDVTGRGVRVDVLARRGTTAALAPRLVDEVRMTHYDAVVLCIGSSDAYNLLPEERWRADLAQLTDILRAATTPTTVVAVLGIRPLQRPNAALGRAGRLVDAHATRLDRVAAEVCARRTGVLHLLDDDAALEAPRTPEAYDALAGRIAPALASELDLLAARPAPSGARRLRDAPDPEADRQQALDRTGLLESGSNPRLDRLLRSAKELFGITGAAVTFVDGDRVVMKAAVGMPAIELPRSVAPCDRTIRRNGALVLGDTRTERIAAEGWLFYAGHPLESPDGYRIGALCLLDTRPHDPLTVDRVALAEVAARIESELWAEVGQPTGSSAPLRAAVG
ncbi:SGNH/GDSL hydrolase family protein [Amnibacterium kyonggiense]|uniref:GDSL-like lipase/acylhydrolase family protein n=1 Tax=Amnibacterium kyonggiense TaxID=595671 RepID=A0A4R7FR44_9MICO|nr:SGNH/GDSL hydrolase family protein [Amnibacterium kyonggiense]TDS80196.1 GDSL-like lipase/acylhydrolase family protein [Amnibacterium kyonggiense]